MSNLFFEGSYTVVNLIFSLIVCFSNLAAGRFPIFEWPLFFILMADRVLCCLPPPTWFWSRVPFLLASDPESGSSPGSHHWMDEWGYKWLRGLALHRDIFPGCLRLEAVCVKKVQSPIWRESRCFFSFSFSQELLWPRLRAGGILGQTAGKWDVNTNSRLLELRLSGLLIYKYLALKSWV